MYAHIDGIVAEKNADSLVIDCGGVGYELICSRATLGSAPRVGERMKCFTILSVREDAMELFGFATREEKSLYEKLRAVSGIGPRTALNILSSLSVRELSIAIVTGDVNALSRAPGVGKKTAQRIALELKDKVSQEDVSAVSVGGAAPVQSMAADCVTEALEALQALGYTPAEARNAVQSVRDQSDKTDELIKLALRSMAGM